MDTYKISLILLVIVLQAMQDSFVSGRPNRIPEVPLGCSISQDVDRLCQQCAKHTKSNVVYPMCCNNTEDAQDFCKQYLRFGLQSTDSQWDEQ